MLGEKNYTLDIRPTFVDELDAAVRYIERTSGTTRQLTISSPRHTQPSTSDFSHQNLLNRAIESRMFANPTIAYPSGTSRFTTLSVTI